MDFGISFFPTDQTLQPVELARAVEDRDFDSLWFAEHSHIPTSRATPWGGRDSAPPLPEKYWRTHDAFVALGAAAAVTDRLLLGTGITLVAQRDPVWTAKEVASLDVISGGRFQFGIGYGWNKEEMATHGTAYTDRRDMLREHVLAMKSLWTEEVAEFEGEYVSLEPSWAWPKPAQDPHPPILMGAGAGPKTIAHMVEFCDGWIPLGRHDIGESTAEVLQAVEDAGRDPDEFQLVSYGTKPTAEFVDRLAELGFEHAVFAVDSTSPDQVLERLDELADFTHQYRS